MAEQALTVAPPGVLAVLNRSDLDGQIASAKSNPRDLVSYHERSYALVTRNEQVADECLYALKRGDKVIEGPSVRFAEILASHWGNCRVAAQVVEEGAEFITARGTFHDLESNTTIVTESRRRIIDSKGRRYGIDMIQTTANAAMDIAKRQAILGGIPQAYWLDLFEAAKQRAAGSGDDLPKRRADAIAAFGRFEVDQPRILAVLGVERIDDIGIDELTKLRGMFQAIKDGELSVAEAFPALRPQPNGETGQPMSAADAFEAGRKACHANAGRTQWPARMRDKSLIEAWQAGWDRAIEEKSQ